MQRAQLLAFIFGCGACGKGMTIATPPILTTSQLMASTLPTT